MKKLDVKKITTVSSDVAITKYQAEYAKVFQQNILLSAQNENQQNLIEYLFNKVPEAFPDDYLIEEENNDINEN
ncbi:hypothetical protein [Companilactobacillus mindensis]|uniref:hypothetical protein n=1 Tax=Companilactobacillus mindensis TaxID=167481 RepID=UPI00070A1355|nr:hypothetical protein [Companilactobacillus mindensis]GEO78533.1 hypothetical protein LMI01_08640 [Companilactobacillus mindensis]